MSAGQGQRRRTKQAPVRAADVAERAEATRAAILTAARSLFTQKGYFATGTEEVVEGAGVGTRGALYHHFANKKELFVAVFHAVAEELHGNTPSPEVGDGAFEALRTGLRRYLRSSLGGEVQQVLLIDGPAVLGWKEWRDLQAQYGLGEIRALLAASVAEGTISALPVDILAGVLLAATDEAALSIANADDPKRASMESLPVIDALLMGLRRT